MQESTCLQYYHMLSHTKHHASWMYFITICKIYLLNQSQWCLFFIPLSSSQSEQFIFKHVSHYNIIVFHIMLSTSSTSSASKNVTLSSATSSCSSSCYSFSLVNSWSNTLSAIQTPHISRDCHMLCGHQISLYTAKYVIHFLHLQKVSVQCHYCCRNDQQYEKSFLIAVGVINNQASPMTCMTDNMHFYM